MTYQTSSAENKVGLKFFSGELKRSWSNFVLYFVVSLFTLTIPVIMFFQNQDMAFVIEKDIVSYVRNSAMLSAFAALACAVFAGCVATKYLNSKVSAYFFHSIPVKRETLYLSKISIGLISYISTFILNVVFAFIIIAAKFGMSALIFKSIALLVMYALLMFLFAYFLTVCVGMICGSTGFQFVLTGVAMFIVPAMFAAIILIADKYYTYTDVDWYLSSILQYLSPVTRIIEAISDQDNLRLLEVIIILALSAVLGVLAILIYRKRGNENAENPLAFPRLISVVKFIIMIPATLYMGLILEALSGNDSWLFIGFFLGAALSFMLLNTILHKNAREMFKGIKGFVIYCVIFAALFLAFALDIAKFDKYIPSENMIASVNISLQDRDYGNYKDDDVIKALKADLMHYMDVDSRKGYEYTHGYDKSFYRYNEVKETKDSDWAAPENEPEYYKSNEVYIIASDRVDVDVVFYTKSGIPIAKTYHIFTKEFITDTLRAIADSDEFEKYFSDMMKYDDSIVDIETNIAHIKGRSYEHEREKIENFFDKYKKDFGDICYENFQKPQVGYLYISRGEGRYVALGRSLPIFIDFKDTIKASSEYYDADDVIEFYLKLIDSATIFKPDNQTIENEQIITDKEELRKILSSISLLGATDVYNADIQIFTEYDYEYAVILNYSKDYIENADDYNKYDTYAAYFLRGKTPDFVK